MRKIRTILELFLVCMIFLVVLFPPSILVLPFKQKLRNTIINPFWKLFSRLVLFFPLRCRVLTIDRRRIKAEQNALYIVNHQSFIDIPLLSAHIQVPPMMKHEVLYIPLFGIVGLVSGAITVKRKDPHSRKQALLEAQNRLLNQFPVQYYPEGTRSKIGRPKPYEEIYKSLIEFCYNNKIPVIPIALYGTNQVLNRNGSINHGRPLGIILEKEIFPEEFSTKEEFSKTCWNKVLEGYEELRGKLNSTLKS